MTRYSAEADSDPSYVPIAYRRSRYPVKRPRITEGSTRSNRSLDDAEGSQVHSSDEHSDEGREVQPPSEAARLNSTRDRSREQSTEAPPIESSSRDRSGSVQLTLTDPDVLDCPICLEPLSSPVYQCDNGHLACASCCDKMNHICGSCALPIGYNRCRGIEKVIESIKIVCPNKKHGCTELLPYIKKLDHEKSCEFFPCTCPHPNCSYTAPSKSLYTHFFTRHSSTMFSFDTVFPINWDPNEKYLFLQERLTKIVFILIRGMGALECNLFVVCISPNSPEKQFSYELMVREGESSIQLKTVAECFTNWNPYILTKKYLFVSDDFFNEAGSLKLELVIHKFR